MLISLDQIKRQLHLDPEPDDGLDEQLTDMYQSALDHCSMYLNRPVPFDDDEELNPSVKRAMLLLIGDFFANREANIVGASVAVNPTVENLLWPHRRGPKV